VTTAGEANDLPSVSVVVPVFNGSETLTELVQRINDALRDCTVRHEIILVNDASADRSWATIEGLVASDASVRGLDLTRNYGQHNALLAGIREARCEVIVTIDDDLQNPPEEIPLLLQALTPTWDVVYGKPIVKRHGFGRRMATRLVVRALGALGGKTAPMVSAFRAFRTELRDGFADYVGPDVSIDGLLTWQTDRFRSVQVRHDARVHGASNYSLRKLVRHALTMITAFSTRPLRIATTMGFFVILFGVAVFVYVMAVLVIEGHSVPGFPFLASIISIFSGAQLFAIGVIGEYLARVHVRVMSRPSYSVRTKIEGGGRRSTTRPGSAEAGEPPCERLAWDSAFWGFPIARVNSHQLDRRQADQVAAWCGEEDICCAFLLANAGDAGTARAAESVGFVAFDTRVTLRRPAATEAGPLSANRSFSIREATAGDDEAAAELARSAHTDTRFFFDPAFSSERAGELYATWVRRGLHEDSRHLLIAERDGQLLGYVLVADGPPTVALIAVAEPARGQGVGRSLVAAAVAERANEPMNVVTQARNVAALRLYQGSGFQIVATDVWYHRWQ
jgi:glycosyltransferase involved in cell wall biosynthesis/ribosomal protein S18 acetylase RimI-like enzyme